MILVTFALPFESAAVPRIGARLLHTGVGPDPARAALTAALAANRPDVVIISGFAGALAPNLAVGDIILAGHRSSPEWFARARERLPTARPVHLVTVNDIVATAADKARLRSGTGADAVDMETAVLCAVCVDYAVPVLALRVISDAAADDLVLPPGLLAAGARGDFSGALRIAGHLAVRPHSWRRFGRFVAGTQRARQALGSALGQLLDQSTEISR